MKIKEVQKWKLSEEMMHAGVAVEKIQKCHCQFDEKLKELQQEGHIIPSHDMIKTPEQIEKIKESGKSISLFWIMLQSILKLELQHSRLMTGYMNRQHPVVQSLLH